jgi:hypothetical protein
MAVAVARVCLFAQHAGVGRDEPAVLELAAQEHGLAGIVGADQSVAEGRGVRGYQLAQVRR